MLRSAFALQSVFVAASLVAFASPQQTAPGQRSRAALPVGGDCNLNGIDDLQEIALGISEDCDANLVPDDCDLGRVTLVATSFESGIPAGWSMTGGWHVTGECSPLPRCDGTNYAYFGEDTRCSFEGPCCFFGSLTLPEVVVPATATSLELSYCSAYEGEGSDPYDAADVVVNGFFVEHVSPEPQFAWEVRTVDLSSYTGQTISIQFFFNQMDQFANDFRGWQVDDVRLSFGIGAAAADCNRNGVPDGCDVDCDLNGIPDECDLALGAVEDCNLNGVPDSCDVAAGGSADCNLNSVPDECDLSIPLTEAVANLASSQAVITSFFPDTFGFSGGEVGTCFNLGIDLALFNCGNRINTNLATGVHYTNSSVAFDPAFGPASQYFTAKHDGLFVMAAVDCSIDTFEISGSNVASAGTVDGLELSTVVDGQLYTIYVKRVYDAAEPSINQILVIPGDGTGVTHTFPASASSSSQILDGLAGIDRIFYVLVSRYEAGVGGLPLRPVDAQEIVRELLGGVPAPVSIDGDGNGIPDECD